MKSILMLIGLSWMCSWARAQTGWQNQSSGTSYVLFDVHFIDHQKGWAVGDAEDILKTVDGGATWTSHFSGISNGFRSVHFADSLHGWAVGGFGGVMQTQNGGISWTKKVLPVSFFPSVHFVNRNIGWVVGSGGAIYKTLDGGDNWSAQASGTVKTLKSVHFTDSSHGHVVGDGIILRTANGGESWITTSQTFNIDFQTVFCINGQIAVAAGVDGKMVKTINGGILWQLVNNLANTGTFKSIHFINAERGYLATSNGSILTTTNGGETWASQPTGFDNWLMAVHFSDSLNGWAVGVLGKIFHTSSGGIPVANKTLVSSPTFSLYPNPAEEYVNLQTSSPIQSIRVADGLGRSVETQNFVPLTGNRLNISSLTPGLYTIKIQTADGTAVQRVVKK